MNIEELPYKFYIKFCTQKDSHFCECRLKIAMFSPGVKMLSENPVKYYPYDDLLPICNLKGPCNYKKYISIVRDKKR
jgi:hypothetical protein